MLKKSLIVSASFAVLILSAQVQAADAPVTSQDFKTLKMPAQTTVAPAAAPAKVATSTTPQKKGVFKGGAHIVPDKTPGPTIAASTAPTPAVGAAKISSPAKPDQGYSSTAAYNVVNDQNKPVTQDWTKPKSWRIGYKNKNRTPINE